MTAQQFALGPTTSNTDAFNSFLGNNLNIPVDGNSNFNVSATIQVSYEAIDGVTQDLIMNTWSFTSVKDVMQSKKPANQQDAKYNEKIQVFGVKAAKSASSSIFFSIFVTIGLVLYYS